MNYITTRDEDAKQREVWEGGEVWEYGGGRGEQRGRGAREQGGDVEGWEGREFQVRGYSGAKCDL